MGSHAIHESGRRRLPRRDHLSERPQQHVTRGASQHEQCTAAVSWEPTSAMPPRHTSTKNGRRTRSRALLQIVV